MKLKRIRVGKGVVAIAIITCCLRVAVFVESWVQHSSATTVDAVFLAILAVMTLSLIFLRVKDKQAGDAGLTRPK